MRDQSEPILVTRASLPPIEEYVEKLQHIWETAWLTNMGEYHEELKEELKKYLGVEGLELFVNGHTALEMVLQAFQLKGEVITTPFSFASTTHAIVRNNLTPVSYLWRKIGRKGSWYIRRCVHVQPSRDQGV